MYLTITSEDELYARTIRTVHIIAKRMLSLNDMDALLDLQWANGVTISFDHSSQCSNISGGGVAAWLHCGALVFHSARPTRPGLFFAGPRALPLGSTLRLNG